MSDDLRDAIAATASTEWSCCVIEERIPDAYWMADAVLAMPEIVDMLAENERLKKRVETLERIYHENQALHRLVGDLTVARYCIEFTRADHHCFDAHSTSNEWLKWDAKRAALWDSCPPSVRAALRSSGGES